MNHQFKNNKNDEYYTPEYAVDPIIEFIKKGTVVWCPFDTPESNYVKIIGRHTSVMYSHISDGGDFFKLNPSICDIIVSNPPYSIREKVLCRLFEIGKPFAMLINDAGLFDSKIRFNLFSTNKFEIMVFDRRISYVSEGKKSSVPFKSIYLCSNVLPSQFVFKAIKDSAKNPSYNKRLPVRAGDSSPLPNGEQDMKLDLFATSAS